MTFYTGSCDFAAHHASHIGTFHTRSVFKARHTNGYHEYEQQ